MKRILLILLVLPIISRAEKGDFSASIGVESRIYFERALNQKQPENFAASVFFEPEWKWRSEDRSRRFSFIGFVRADEKDSERTHADIRELNFSINKGDWTTTVGVNKVFWGVTESLHLVDVINQTDWVEDIDGEDKLGQPMLLLSQQKDWGKLDFFILPYFRDRTFPGVEGRFSFGLDVSDDSVYESTSEQKHVDWALRYSHYIGDMDLGISWFDGTNREPVLTLNQDGDELAAYYQQMTQVGVDLQYTKDAWLWKLESIYRDTTNDSFFAAVAGFEYTFYQLYDAADLGVLLEYQYDDRNELSPQTSADNDVFVAARFALNDSQDTSVLAGVIVDTDSSTSFLNIEAERRFGENLNAKLRLRSLSNVDEEDVIFGFRNDDYAQVSLSWYF